MSGRSLSEIDRAGWVFTPGGPRPRANVHEVNPGDVIIHDRGTGGSTIFRAANAAGSEAGARSVEELVITPGGARPRSQVHEVQSGAVITAARVGHHATGEDATRPDRLARATLRLARNTFASEDLPALGSGYITYAAWTNGTGRAISSFSTTWTVPPPPRTQSGQLLYLFNGLEDSPVTHILQPVLQWGVSPNGGGNSWAVASWWVDNSNNATKTPLVQVNPGDILVGVMTLLSQSGGSFSYSCEFSNISGTRMTVQGTTRWSWPWKTLECYRITQCPDYPDVNGTAMTGIDIKAGGVDVTPSWGAVNAVTDCGQHTVVVSNASPGGEVDLFYRPTDWSGVADNWRPIGGFFPPAPRSPRSPAPGTTWTCSSRATTAGSTPPGGAPATTGRGWPTTGAPSADSSPRAPRSPRSPAPGTTWTCSSRATTAGSTPPGGAPATTGRGWPTTGAPIGGFFPPAAPVSSVARTGNNLDLFITGNDGRVYTSWWSAGNDWSGVADNWRPIGGFFPPVRPGLLGRPHREQPGPVHHGQRRPGLHLLVERRQRLVGGGRQLAAHRRILPRAPRSPRSPAPGTTWTCSSRATTAGSTPPGGAPATTGRGWPTTGAPSADSSPLPPRSPRSPAPGTTWTCSSRATTAGSTPPGGAPATTGRGWPTTGAPSADSSPLPPRSPRSPAPGTTWTCSSRATTAGSTPPGGSIADSGYI